MFKSTRFTPSYRSSDMLRDVQRDIDQVIKDVRWLMLEERLERFRQEFRGELQQTLQVIRERDESPDRTNEKDPGGAATPRDQSVSYIHKEDLHE